MTSDTKRKSTYKRCGHSHGTDAGHMDDQAQLSVHVATGRAQNVIHWMASANALNCRWQRNDKIRLLSRQTEALSTGGVDWCKSLPSATYATRPAVRRAQPADGVCVDPSVFFCVRHLRVGWSGTRSRDR